MKDVVLSVCRAHITPSEASRLHYMNKYRPDQVLEAINRLLVKNYDENGTKILQSELIDLILNLMKRDCVPVSYLDAFGKEWVKNLENEYSGAFWNVEYHVEDSGPYWIFYPR